MNEDEFGRLPSAARRALRDAGQAPDQQPPEPPPVQEGILTYEEFMRLPIRVRIKLRQEGKAP